MLHSLKYDYNKMGVSSSYPRTNDCYIVEISDDKGNKWTSNFMPKEEYELIMKLQHLKKKMTMKELEELTKAIDAYGEMKYTHASDDAAMDAAGEAL